MFSKESEYICDRCRSYETVELRPKYTLAVGVVFLGLGAWTFSIPVIGLILTAFAGICLLISPFLIKLHYCKNCKNIWKVK